MRDLAGVAAENAKFKKAAIPIFLGTDAQGNPVIEDLSTMPTFSSPDARGAGKSVFLNSLILSILMTRHPEDVRLVMVDPKQVELKVYQGIPHLLTRVDKQPEEGDADSRLGGSPNGGALRDPRVVRCPQSRVLQQDAEGGSPRGARTRLHAEQIARIPERMHSIVVIVDKFADLIMAAGKELEQSIARLAQKARAVGIHIVLATQRPEVKAITGLIKANLPPASPSKCRSSVDSAPSSIASAPNVCSTRATCSTCRRTATTRSACRGPFCSDEEVARVVSYLKEKASGLYAPTLIAVGAGESSSQGGDGADRDESSTKPSNSFLIRAKPRPHGCNANSDWATPTRDA
jgi:S-DNA-T family DNA segregation ATPase FtsK/SpoIIIE